MTAEDGKNGSGTRSAGRSGKDLIVEVPIGTVVYRKKDNQARVADDVFSGNKVGGLANYDSRAFATTGANDEASPVTTAVGAEQTESLLSVSRRRPADDLRSTGASDPVPRTDASQSPLHYAILCPHYEGYDERILSIVDYKISLGKYILTGGELPALIIIDSIVRLIPGVLGGETSAEIESFSDGDNLEFPQYTKPYDFRGMTVPDVLLSGNHGEIAKWRAEHSGNAEE